MLAPVGAQLIQRKLVHPRVLILFSLSVMTAAMWHYSTFSPSTDYRHYALARGYQGLGYGFFFVSVNILAYSQLRPDQNNRASSLTNFFRNWGGSFGIALVTTVAERRQEFHQSNLGSALTASSQQLAERSRALVQYLVSKGYTGADAATAAQGGIYQQLQHQVSLLAFMDCFRVIALLTAVTIPLILLVRNFQVAGKAPAGH
jgi:DHA2 family multidrug resistance protein